jgi:L-threonylcarbamoyladenylate synthase
MGRSVAAAARRLRAGALVVYPTDTIYGLAARASSEAAVRRLVRAKGRTGSQPLSIAVSSVPELEPLARLTPPARRWVRRNLPGPYTVLVRPSPLARERLAASVAGGAAIALRVPDHPVARALARAAGPIVATSANRHGEPPARSLAEARAAFGRAVAVYQGGAPPPSGVPSLLVDLRGSSPKVRARP